MLAICGDSRSQTVRPDHLLTPSTQPGYLHSQVCRRTILWEKTGMIVCGSCAKRWPWQNLRDKDDKILSLVIPESKDPECAVAVFIGRPPTWQYCSRRSFSLGGTWWEIEWYSESWEQRSRVSGVRLPVDIARAGRAHPITPSYDILQFVFAPSLKMCPKGR